MSSLSQRDGERIERALEAARRARRHEQRFGPNWTEDEAAVDAISKALEEIAEHLIGAQQQPGVSAETRAAHPEIPWSDIRGMRQILVHGYHRKDLGILASTLRESVPDLIAKLEELLR